MGELVLEKIDPSFVQSDKINHRLLEEFFERPLEEMSSEVLSEVNKVINSVLYKFFGSFYYAFSDLRDIALLAVMEHHASYDPTRRAMPYIFTICRNAIQNTTYRYPREPLYGEFPEWEGWYEKFSVSNAADLPLELDQYVPYLVGEVGFGVIELPQSIVSCLLHLLERGSHRRSSDTEVSSNIISKLLNLLYNGKEE